MSLIALLLLKIAQPFLSLAAVDFYDTLTLGLFSRPDICLRLILFPKKKIQPKWFSHFQGQSLANLCVLFIFKNHGHFYLNSYSDLRLWSRDLKFGMVWPLCQEQAFDHPQDSSPKLSLSHHWLLIGQKRVILEGTLQKKHFP